MLACCAAFLGCAVLTGCAGPAAAPHPRAAAPALEPSAEVKRAAEGRAGASPQPEHAAAPDPSSTDAAAWPEHTLHAFAGRFSARVPAERAPKLTESAAPVGARGDSERASLVVPVGEARAVDCHLRAARLSPVELSQSVAKLVEAYEVETLQASVEQLGPRLVLRYTQRVTDASKGERVGTMRVAMAVGEGESLLCTQLGGEHGGAFERVSDALFRSATGLATAAPAYLDILRVRDTSASTLEPIEHRLRVRSELPAGKTFETALALNATMNGGKLLVTETTTVLELDATGEVQLASITTIDSAANRVEVGLIRLGPKRYGAGVKVAGREQMSPIVTSSPLTTELSMAPAIRSALDRAGAGGRAKLAWSELGGLGRGREVSVIESRELERDARTKELLVRSRDEVLRDCELDARGVLVRCRVERAGAPSSVVRERLYPSPSSAR